MNFTSFFLLSLLLTFIINTSLGIFVLLKKPQNALHQSAFFFIACISGWIISIFFLIQTSTYFWILPIFIFSFFIPAGILFLLSDLGINDEKKSNLILSKRYFLMAPLLMSVVFITFPTLFIIPPVRISIPQVITNTGPLYFFTLAYFLGNITVIFFYALSLFQKTSGIKKLQLKYFFTGFFIFASLALFSNQILPFLGIKNFNGLGPLFSIIMVGFTVYAIIHYRFLDITLILRNNLIKFFTLTLSSSLAILIWFLIEKTNQNKFLSMVFAVITAILFYNYFRPLLEIFFQHFFFKKNYNSQKTIKKISSELNRFIHIHDIADAIIGPLKTVFSASKARLVVSRNADNNPKDLVQVVNSGFNDREFLERNDVIDIIYPLFSVYKKPLIIEEVKFMVESLSKDLQALLLKAESVFREKNCALVVPLIQGNNILGIMLFGEKENHEAYTQQDIELIETISYQASTAVHNAILYEKIEEFNATLQLKIEDQTKHLKELLEMKQEFLHIISHQLRTPITILRGTLEFASDPSLPLEKKHEFIQKASLSSDRLLRLVNNLLGASQLAAGKIENMPEICDIRSIIKESLSEREIIAKQKNIAMTFENDSILPDIYADPLKIREVINNLLDNALHYTLKGSIAVSAKRHNETHIEVSVQDTGIGIHPDEKAKILEKFRRSKHSSVINPDGTGLGLYIVKEILKNNHGYLKIQSSGENAGSVFSIFLPVHFPYQS